MKYLPLSLALCLSGALVGCSTSPSKPVTFDQLGQFSSYALNQNIYRVSFQSERTLSHSHAEEIVLLKAAQTTLQQGFRYFKVLDDPSNRSQNPPRRTVVYPTPMYYPYGFYGARSPFWQDPFYNHPQIVSIEPLQVSYSIECYQTLPANSQAFDARLILQSIGPKYGLSPQGQVLIERR